MNKLFLHLTVRDVSARVFSIKMGLACLMLTFIYDLFTNIIFALTFKLPIITTIIAGWVIPPWFGILHEVSNLILFFSTVYPLIRIIRHFR